MIKLTVLFDDLTYNKLGYLWVKTNKNLELNDVDYNFDEFIFYYYK